MSIRKQSFVCIALAVAVSVLYFPGYGAFAQDAEKQETFTGTVCPYFTGGEEDYFCYWEIIATIDPRDTDDPPGNEFRNELGMLIGYAGGFVIADDGFLRGYARAYNGAWLGDAATISAAAAHVTELEIKHFNDCDACSPYLILKATPRVKVRVNVPNAPARAEAGAYVRVTDGGAFDVKGAKGLVSGSAAGPDLTVGPVTVPTGYVPDGSKTDIGIDTKRSTYDPFPAVGMTVDIMRGGAVSVSAGPEFLGSAEARTDIFYGRAALDVKLWCRHDDADSNYDGSDSSGSSSHASSSSSAVSTSQSATAATSCSSSGSGHASGSSTAVSTGEDGQTITAVSTCCTCGSCTYLRYRRN